MKTLAGLIIFSVIAGCNAAAPRIDGESVPGKGGGKSHSVVLTGTAEPEGRGMSFYLVAKDKENGWNKDDRLCIEKLARALELSGYSSAASASDAELLISVNLPKSTKATGFSFVAFMGAYRHSVELEAKNTMQQEVWKLKAQLDHEIDDRTKVFPFLALAMINRFGSELNEETVSAYEFDSRLERINAD